MRVPLELVFAFFKYVIFIWKRKKEAMLSCEFADVDERVGAVAAAAVGGFWCEWKQWATVDAEG